jgi:oligopeptide/dipeptide ABC transporter ATP-binding protein
MEVGATEEVIHRPRNPYTRALIDAVPSPDPDVPWNLGDGSDTGDTHNLPQQGCAFAPRCPHAMPKCHGERPPLFDSDPLCATSCWLAETPEHTTATEIHRRVAGTRAAGAPVPAVDDL